MMITLRDERFCPIVTCDYCDAVINDVALAHYVWPGIRALDEQPVPVQFIHKHCDAAWQAAQPPGEYWARENLSALAALLTSNLGLSAAQSDAALARVDVFARIAVGCPDA